MVRFLRLGLFLGLVGMAGCSSQSNAAKSPSPESVLEAIPAPDQAQVDAVRDMKSWRNPYLIVRSDGVVLFDVTDSAEIQLKTDELLPALANLPKSYWPYGRIVAAVEKTSGSEQDLVEMRRNRGIVGGMLAGAHVAVKWVQ